MGRLVWLVGLTAALVGGAWAQPGGAGRLPYDWHPSEDGENLDLSVADELPDAEWVALESLTNLRELTLPSGRDAVLVHLKPLRLLRCLIIDDEDVTDEGLRMISELPALEHLELTTALVTDAGMAHLAGLSHLVKLVLRAPSGKAPLYTEAGFAAIGRLSDLITLEIEPQSAGDEALAHLRGLIQLRFLEIHPRDLVEDDDGRLVEGVTVTDEGMDAFTYIPNLIALDLPSAVVGDAGFAALAGLSRLESLALRHAEVTDASAPVLARLTSLKGVALGARFTDASAELLAGIARLHTLLLWGSDFSDEGVARLAQTSAVAHLRIGGHGITDGCAPDIAGMWNLSEVRLEHTQLTPAGVAAFRKARPRCSIQCLPPVALGTDVPPGI